MHFISHRIDPLVPDRTIPSVTFLCAVKKGRKIASKESKCSRPCFDTENAPRKKEKGRNA